MSINEINPANSLKTGLDSFTGLPGSISDINRELFGQSLSKAPNSAFGSIPMNPLLESDDRSISAIQTKARFDASSVYGNESGIFPIDRAAQQVGKALMDNPITAPVPSGDRRVDRIGQYDELLNPNPSNLSATVLSGDTQKELGTGSDRRELQKADDNGFTEREAYKLPGKNVYYEVEVKLGDTLWSIAAKELGNPFLWRSLKTEDNEHFKDEDVRRIQLGTKVYVPIKGKVTHNKVEGTALEKRWIEYFRVCQSDETDKIFTERTWRYGEGKEKGEPIKFPVGSKKIERRLDIVWITKTGDVIGFEIKRTEEAEDNERRKEKERDQDALDQKAKIRDPKTGVLHKVDKVWRIQGEPPADCKKDIEPEKPENITVPKKVESAEDPGVEVEPPGTERLQPEDRYPGVEVEPGTEPPRPQDYRSPVGSEKDSEEDPEVDVERRKPKPRNINPPRFNVPARPPAIESPKPIDDAPARPPARPPIDDAPARPPAGPPIDEAPARPPAGPPARPPAGPPARPPARPPALSGALNIGSKIARPLGVVTDVIDLKNAYDEDGGFGKNFQETAGSVAGGWGGAAAGAAAGAALGSVVPGLGTVAGGIVGGVIGGIGGSAAGEGIVKGVRDFFG